MTFEEWWCSTHEWPLGSGGLYEERFKQAYQAGYDSCRDHWGGLTYNDPTNDFTNHEEDF